MCCRHCNCGCHHYPSHHSYWYDSTGKVPDWIVPGEVYHVVPYWEWPSHTVLKPPAEDMKVYPCTPTVTWGSTTATVPETTYQVLYSEIQ